MSLAQKLKRVLKGEEGAKKVVKDFSQSMDVRRRVKEVFAKSVPEFCSSKLDFDGRHGIIYKLLKTEPKRLRNGILTANDMNYWLRQNKVVPALWIVKLAGPTVGAIPRNQLLAWLEKQKDHTTARTVFKWTKKWGIKEDERSLAIVAHADSVSSARSQYKDSKLTSKARQIVGNNLLKSVAAKGSAEEVYSFYKTLNKDLITFQLMFSAMRKNAPLRAYKDEVWQTALRHNEAGNIKIDAKLRETYEVLEGLPDAKTEQPDQEVKTKTKDD